MKNPKIWDSARKDQTECQWERTKKTTSTHTKLHWNIENWNENANIHKVNLDTLVIPTITITKHASDGKRISINVCYKIFHFPLFPKGECCCCCWLFFSSSLKKAQHYNNNITTSTWMQMENEMRQNERFRCLCEMLFKKP